MAKKIVRVLIDFEAPDTINAEAPNPPGEGKTSPLAEITKIIRDGCGDSYIYERFNESGIGIGDAVFYLEEVT